jgi:hypothetical protein
MGPNTLLQGTAVGRPRRVGNIFCAVHGGKVDREFVAKSGGSRLVLNRFLRTSRTAI